LEGAQQLLLAADGNLEEAVMLHFGMGDDLPVTATGSSASAGGSTGSGSNPAGRGAGYTGAVDAEVPLPVAARQPQGPRLFTGAEQPGLPPLGTDAGSTAAEQEEEAPAAEVKEESGGWFASIGNAVSRLSQVVLGISSEEFENWFTTRYGTPCPAWSKDSFGDTVTGALSSNRLLLLWFHQDENDASENLCRQVFQNTMVIEMVKQSYVCWAGDVNRFEPGQIARLLGANTFPTVVVLQPLRHGYDHTFCLEWPLNTFAQPLFRLSPTVPGEALNADQAITALVTAAQDHGDAQQIREEERMARDNRLAEDRRLREEQQRELEESMLIDQMKKISEQEAKEAEAASAAAAAQTAASTPATGQEAATSAESSAAPLVEAAPTPAAASPPVDSAAEAEEAEAKRLARREEILALPEPETAGTATAKISLKLPAGDRLQRVFRVEQQLREVYEWAHCCRPTAKPASFELWTNFPAKALTDRDMTVGEHGLAPGAALFMKAVDD
jgi:hypothetical protein